MFHHFRRRYLLGLNPQESNMPKSHRADVPTLADEARSILSEVRQQIGDREIIEAVQALTIGYDAYHKTFTVRGRRVRLENRGPDARMGRFGGGWQTQVGFQTGSSGLRGTIIVNLGRGSIRIDPKGN